MSDIDDKPENNDEEREKIDWMFFLCLAGTLFTAVGGILLITYRFSELSVQAGMKLFTPEYGDAFGALNTLFSGLAFALLVVTLWLQMYELRQNRAEIKRTADSQKIQADAMRAEFTLNRKVKLHEIISENYNRAQAQVDKARKAVSNHRKNDDHMNDLHKQLKQSIDVLNTFKRAKDSAEKSLLEEVASEFQ